MFSRIVRAKSSCMVATRRLLLPRTGSATSKNCPARMLVVPANVRIEESLPTVTIPMAMASTPNIIYRSYHASSLREAVRRRRRRGQATMPSSSNKEQHDDDNNNETSGSSTTTAETRIRRVTDPEMFETVATQLIDKIYAALVPLQSINDPYFLSRDRDPEVANGEYILLDLGPLHGQYTLQVDPEQTLVHFQSPISGMVQYYRSLDDGEWRSMEDGHILEGLLVRDLIRQIKGVPKL